MAKPDQKGKRFELEIIQFLESLEYTAMPSRASDKLEAQGLDIVDNSPFSIQCKHQERFSVPVHELLKSMKANGLENPIVMHKRNNKGVVVSMDLSLFRGFIYNIQGKQKNKGLRE